MALYKINKPAYFLKSEIIEYVGIEKALTYISLLPHTVVISNLGSYNLVDDASCDASDTGLDSGACPLN